MPSTKKSLLPGSHCGGTEKLIFPSLKFTLDTGLALPVIKTNWPTSILVPECLTSNQEGDSFPSTFMVKSHLPSIGVAKELSKLKSVAFTVDNARTNKTNAANSCRELRCRMFTCIFFILIFLSAGCPRDSVSCALLLGVNLLIKI